MTRNDELVTKIDLDEGLELTKQELRAEIQLTKKELQAEIQETKRELQAEIQETKKELQAEIQETKKELRSEIRETEQRLRSEIKETEQRLGEKIAENTEGILELNVKYERVIVGIDTIIGMLENQKQEMKIQDYRHVQLDRNIQKEEIRNNGQDAMLEDHEQRLKVIEN